MERTNHSSSTTWRRRRRREPRFEGRVRHPQQRAVHRGEGPLQSLSVDTRRHPLSRPGRLFRAQTSSLFNPSSLLGPYPEKPKKTTVSGPARIPLQNLPSRPRRCGLVLACAAPPETQRAHQAFGAQRAAPPAIAFRAAPRSDAVILSHPR